MTSIVGFIGAALTGAAYIPQIWHLVRVHCSAGISRPAFGVWLAATFLVTTHAVATRSPVFISLGVVQIIALVTILIYATRYRNSICTGHVPAASERRMLLSITQDALAGGRDEVETRSSLPAFAAASAGPERPGLSEVSLTQGGARRPPL